MVHITSRERRKKLGVCLGNLLEERTLELQVGKKGEEDINARGITKSRLPVCEPMRESRGRKEKGGLEAKAFAVSLEREKKTKRACSVRL